MKSDENTPFANLLDSNPIYGHTSLRVFTPLSVEDVVLRGESRINFRCATPR